MSPRSAKVVDFNPKARTAAKATKALTMALATRPRPPASLSGMAGVLATPTFMRDEVLEAWLRRAFIGLEFFDPAQVSPLINPDHAHLQAATIGCLWTNVHHHRAQKTTLGTAEILNFRSSWKDQRGEVYLTELFAGRLPDFLLTFYSPEASEIDDASFCALVEHELYHCIQALDQDGQPRFHAITGDPIWGLRGHDIEQFNGVIRRYGVGPAMASETALAIAAGPTVAPAAITAMCGTCQQRATG